MNAPLPATRDAVEALIDAIHADPAEPWTAESMARHARYSHHTLPRVFRRHTSRSHPPLIGAGGTTPHAYLIAVRMAAAKHLLRATDLTVTGIGERVGYRAPNVFARQFRLAHGMYPTAYRKQARGGAS